MSRRTLYGISFAIAACAAMACASQVFTVQAMAVQTPSDTSKPDASKPDASKPDASKPDASKPEYYVIRVRPVLDANCGRCHEGVNRRGGLNMETRDSLLKGGHHGPAIVPGDPANSLMVKLIHHAGPSDDPMNMPPNKPPLNDGDIRIVEEWIKAGAVMPTQAP